MKKRKKFSIILITLTCVVLVSYGLFQISKSRTFQFFGGLTDRVTTNEKVIALTFDDAPSEFTDEVLEILKQKRIKATFYAIGEELARNPEQGKHITEQGHELGNHSYSHQRFLLKSPSFVDQEIQKTNSLIRATGYNGEITFRPPTGKKLLGLPWYLQQHQIKTIMWDIEPDTYVDSKLNSQAKTAFLINYTVARINYSPSPFL